MKINQMNMNKSGMGVGEVFIFIIAAITFALIMIFGYKAISGLISGGEDVAFVQFKTDLESSIKKIYTEYGAVRVEEFHAPSKYTQICFVDMDFADETKMEKLKESSPAAYDAWKTAKEDFSQRVKNNRPDLSSVYAAADQNVFLKPAATVPIKLYQITINDENEESQGFLCEPIRQGTFTVILEGKGSHTQISRVQYPTE